MTDTATERYDGSGTPKIAVTGAAGYIGSRVVDRLQATHPDWEITALDNFYLGKVDSIGDVNIQHVDIRNRHRLEEAIEGADVVLHLAAVSGVDDCEEHADLAYEVNVTGTNNVAWFCRRTGAALTFPFSMAVLGDPESFPITVDLPRQPMNWYGRTKYISERSIETFAKGSFPAHQLMKSNLYGEHEINGTAVSKSTVINFFVSRVEAGEPLTVYEPGSQSRNFIHVKDVARSYVRSAERLLDQLEAGETGSAAYEIAGTEDPSVMEVAQKVQRIAGEELGEEPEVKLVENPRAAETNVEDFTVDISKAKSELGWEPTHTVEESIRDLLQRRA
ncbi:NAD-dependent epimerase/dehydratase family protein [Natronomonas salina]|uniref:NAD-dependent epimerase/dehydratase family protein n=1 Tax=Natronomonas salina TaxID=1710540 RepID=UPI0015B782AE|nr:NAD-dependent epimerase/dehydratase family protein [Natronomonas salina]QLD90778.1 NAD-dependent epimerase/dehydratase family protein [Natronomonas salina]